MNDPATGEEIEKPTWAELGAMNQELQQLREQLTAEREKYADAAESNEKLIEQLAAAELARINENTRAIAAERELAAERDAKMEWAKSCQQLRKELAAERETLETAADYNERLSKINTQLREQLAAERRKNDDWRNTERRVAKERDEARQQLVAEREAAIAATAAAIELTEQLAAERSNYALALQMKNIETNRANKAEAALAAERESHEKELDLVEKNWSEELAAERSRNKELQDEGKP